MKTHFLQTLNRFCFIAVLFSALGSGFFTVSVDCVSTTIEVSLSEIDNSEDRIQDLEELQEEENEFLSENSFHFNLFESLLKLADRENPIPLGYLSDSVPPPRQNC